MKTKLTIIAAFYILFNSFSFAQNKNDSCGAWESIIKSIEKVDTAFVVTAENLMPDCSPIGIYFEYWANEFSIRELKIGSRIDVNLFKPKKGYWRYKGIYTEETKRNRKKG